MTVAEIGPEALESATQLDPSSVCVQWSSGYYDGPLDGIAELDGKVCWFTIAEDLEDEDSYEGCRRLWLIELTQEQIRFAIQMHEDFVLHVGDHFDHRDDGLRKGGHPRPQSEWDGFYSKYSEDSMSLKALSSQKVLGWFYWPNPNAQQ